MRPESLAPPTRTLDLLCPWSSRSRLVVRGVGPGPLEARSATLFLAIDRPGRLEVSLPRERGRGGSRAGAGASCSEGDRWSAWLDGRRVFEGRVDRLEPIDAADSFGPEPRGARVGEAGESVRLVGHESFEAARRAWAPVELRRLTAAEAAERVACALGLVPVLDPTREVHARIDLGADPLEGLRRLAAGCDRHLAVLNGRLHFARCLPVVERGVILDARQPPVAALPAAAGSALSPCLLERVWVVEPGGGCRPRVVARALHRFLPEGRCARLEFVEDSGDRAPSHRRPPSSIATTPAPP